MSKKFIQPTAHIRIISSPENGTFLTDEILGIGRSRIASGEDPDDVALDLAMYEESLIHSRGHSDDLRALKRTPIRPRLKFGATSPTVLTWAKAHIAELVTNVTDVSRKRIRDVIVDLITDGDWTDATARLVKAVGDEERAELIARHETMLAVSSGQRLAWDEAIEVGLLDSRLKRTWIAVGDEKMCPICSFLDGTTANLQGPYPGQFEGPPAHISCRCTEGLTG